MFRVRALEFHRKNVYVLNTWFWVPLSEGMGASSQTWVLTLRPRGAAGSPTRCVPGRAPGYLGVLGRSLAIFGGVLGS